VIEEELLVKAREEKSRSASEWRRAGACALAVVIKEGRVYSANLGDCKGLLVRVEEDVPNLNDIPLL